MKKLISKYESTIILLKENLKINKCSILNRLRDNMPHEISTKFLKDVATKSLSYNIENSKSKYLPMDLIEDYWEKNYDYYD